MKKRTLSLILATAMVAGSLMGCGGGSAASSSAPAEEPAAEAPAEEPAADAPAEPEEPYDSPIASASFDDLMAFLNSEEEKLL